MEFHLEGVKRMARATDVAFATMDFAGHGQHSQPLETTTRQQQFIEVEAVFDGLTKRGYQKVIVIGGSFGAYMAALLTGSRPVCAAVLRAPANYLDEEFSIPHDQTYEYKNREEHKWLRKNSITSSTPNKALTAIRNFNGPVYVLEHELDKEIPRNLPLDYFQTAKHGNYLVVPKTGHSPKLMQRPQRHFDYIEHLLASVIKAIQLQEKF